MADGLPIWFRDEEEALMKLMGRELIETLINQHFILYSVDVQNTDSNFYGEAKYKVYQSYTKLEGRIQIADTDIYSEGGVRRVAKGDMSAWVYDDLLTENNLTPKVGDFIGFEGKFYEIYDAGTNKDSLDRKLGGDREYFTELLAKVVDEGVFKSIEGDFE